MAALCGSENRDGVIAEHRDLKEHQAMSLSRTLAFSVAAFLSLAALRAEDRPNILWFSAEDHGPHLGCYGDEYATTPNLDAFAEKAFRYMRASSNAPVCAPARTTIITGMYPTALGAEHMRSFVAVPEEVRLFPSYLKEAGYFTSNHTKQDYNVEGDIAATWDKSKSRNGNPNNGPHWLRRKNGQPFFSVYNVTTTHESRLRNEMADELRTHDPAGVRIPAYHPDTPEVRKDWAQYYDRIQQMDAEFGRGLAELDEHGEAENTIVFFWSDHGSGMPRNKRWPYNSGLHVPVIAYFPPKWEHLAPEGYQAGGKTDRLISFVDFAPTMLSLAGIEPKPHMHGQAFAGKFQAHDEGDFSFGFRGRMDERFDMVRTVFGKRFIYIRHFMPHREYGQHIAYMFQTPTTQVWKKLFDEGKLTPEQSLFWQQKPTEELYDLENDPDEVINLVGDPEHTEQLAKMRKVLDEWMVSSPDLGLLPEAEIHKRAGDKAPYSLTQSESGFDAAEILKWAKMATDRSEDHVSKLKAGLGHDNSAIRYWSAIGCLMRGAGAVEAAEAELVSALTDNSESVGIIAAEALGKFGNERHHAAVVTTLLSLADQVKSDPYAAIAAVNAIEALPVLFEDHRDALAALPRAPEKDAIPARAGRYTGDVLNNLLGTAE